MQRSAGGPGGQGVERARPVEGEVRSDVDERPQRRIARLDPGQEVLGGLHRAQLAARERVPQLHGAEVPDRGHGRLLSDGRAVPVRGSAGR